LKYSLSHKNTTQILIVYICTILYLYYLYIYFLPILYFVENLINTSFLRTFVECSQHLYKNFYQTMKSNRWCFLFYTIYINIFIE